MDAINKASMEVVAYIPTGFFLSNTAWRSNVKGIIQSPFPIFWNVEKT